MARRHLWVLSLVAACGQPPRGDRGRDDTDPESTADTSTPPTTGDTGPEPIFDCSSIPAEPLSITQLDAPRGYHDVVFDTLGHILGSDGNALLQVTYDGRVGVFLPGIGTVQGMDWLPNGDLIYADSIGTLMRVPPGGGPSVLGASSGTYTYGVTVGPDGNVYTGTWDSVERYDAETGERTRILGDRTVKPYVVDFSPDHRTLYIGTIWNRGAIWTLDLDEDLNPTGPPTVLTTVGAGPKYLHDAMGVDWCGNIYVEEFYTNNLYRITPEGEVTTLVDFSYRTYGHGLEWGSGIDGWRADALYLPQPYNGNRVVEIVIGVPAREWDGTPWPQ